MSERFLVIGLARAGTAMAIALAKSGANVHVVDQKAADQLSMLKEMDRLEALGIDVTTSWTGEVDWQNVGVIAPSPGVPLRHPTLMEAKERGVPIWSEIEVGYRLSKAPIIAITGTNGKTTVTALTYCILKDCGKDAVLCGNIAGSGYSELPITTAAQQSDESQILVAEVSSYQLEFIDTFRPHICAITNITSDHVERHGSAEEYKKTKRRIFENLTADDFAIVNLDKPETHPPQGGPAKQLTYGKSGDIVISESNVGGIAESSLWAGAHHNLENAAAAWLMARAAGCNDDQIREAIMRFKGVMNRMEVIGEHNGIRFMNNTMCTNPESLRASIEACRAPILLIAGGALEDSNPEPFTRIEQTRIKRAFLVGKDGRLLAPYFENSEVLSDIPAAFARAVSEASIGDTVLLAPGCKSFDQFANFIERGDLFRELVKSYVEGTG
jgi:UDP-N-acetylmuramoylalanine--D-glutamate ligase